jgi:hypothetical protein
MNNIRTRISFEIMRSVLVAIREDNNNFISLEPSFETSGSNDQVRVDYT